MFRLIEKNGLPSRIKRFCCAHLKEVGGVNRISVTGVRWAESVNRKLNNKAFMIKAAKKRTDTLFNDNDEGRRMFENCTIKGKRVVNPIIDWEEDDVWEYLNSRGIEHCILYDEGYKRIGCIGCPMAGKDERLRQFKRYPKMEQAYKRALKRYLVGYIQRQREKGEQPMYETVDKWWYWWIHEQKRIDPNQINILDEREEK
jgi:phosphoadenosine phosphosulfate reductase